MSQYSQAVLRSEFSGAGRAIAHAAHLCIATKLPYAADIDYVGAAAVSPARLFQGSDVTGVSVVVKSPGKPSFDLRASAPSAPGCVRRSRFVSVYLCRRVTVSASASSEQASLSLAAAQHSVSQLLYTLSDVSATAAASDAATTAADVAEHTAKRYSGWFSTLADYLETLLNYLQARPLPHIY